MWYLRKYTNVITWCILFNFSWSIWSPIFNASKQQLQRSLRKNIGKLFYVKIQTWKISNNLNRRRNFDSCQKSLQLEYLFIISEIFLEFIYKLHVLKMSMKPNHPWNPNCLLTENESKNKKNSIKTTKFKFGFEKLKKKSLGKKPKQIMYDCHTERKENSWFFFDSVHNDPKNYFTFRTRLKNKITLPTIY